MVGVVPQLMEHNCNGVGLLGHYYVLKQVFNPNVLACIWRGGTAITLFISPSIAAFTREL